jgi:hypothetical protein
MAQSGNADAAVASGSGSSGGSAVRSICFLKKRTKPVDGYEQTFSGAGFRCEFLSPLTFAFPDDGMDAAAAHALRLHAHFDSRFDCGVCVQV